MKITLLMVAFLLKITSAYADDWSKTCELYSQLAETIMTSRQAGVPMANQMKIAKGENGSDVMVQLIINAYDKPRYNTEDMQQKSIENYRDDIYLACVKELKDKK